MTLAAREPVECSHFELNLNKCESGASTATHSAPLDSKLCSTLRRILNDGELSLLRNHATDF